MKKTNTRVSWKGNVCTIVTSRILGKNQLFECRYELIKDHQTRVAIEMLVEHAIARTINEVRSL
jgi:hypothetical protein